MIRILLVAALLASTVPTRAAATAPEDVEWSAFDHVLTLVESVVRAGMQSNPDAAMAEVLSGHNARVNGALAGLFAGATAELPAEYRDRVASLGREIAGYAAAHPAPRAVPSADRAAKGNEAQKQARKDLNAMGLRYFDERDFLDAAKRNDALAVELFVAGRGVNLGATTWDGRTALDIARANGNTQIAELLSRNPPPGR